MQAKQLTALVLTILTLNLSAQTKKIAHKSHSGSNEHFKYALTENLFGMPSSNFGIAPTKFNRRPKLDSLVYIADSVSVMYTTSYTLDPTIDTLFESVNRDTVYNHPLFSQHHSLDSIKKVMDTQYFFEDPADSTKFINYDNVKSSTEKDSEKTKKEEEEIINPVSLPNDNVDQNGDGLLLPVMIGLITLLSILMGFLVERLAKKGGAVQPAAQ